MSEQKYAVTYGDLSTEESDMVKRGTKFIMFTEMSEEKIRDTFWQETGRRIYPVEFTEDSPLFTLAIAELLRGAAHFYE